MTSPSIADRFAQIPESATLKLNSTVQEMKASGVDLINFTAGEPDFSVQEECNEAVRKALSEKRSKYTPVPGIPELRDAIARKTSLQQPSVPSSKRENIVVSNGGKQALYNLFQVLLNPGDQVLIPSPYWLSYPTMVELAGGEAVPVATRFEDEFLLTPENLKRALDENPRSKVLVLNSPSNPTGSMYSKDDFAKLGEVIQQHPLGQKLWIISDEIYDRIVVDETPFCSFQEATPQLHGQVITCNGMSKSHAMTGWRIGWSAAPTHVTKALIKLQGQSTSGVNALAQWASLAGLALPESAFRSQVDSFRRRKNLAMEILKKAAKIRVCPPKGAFYAFLGVQEYLNEGEDSIQFAERLLKGAKVAVVPGKPFGADQFVRLSFATDDDSLREGCERIVRFLS